MTVGEVAVSLQVGGAAGLAGRAGGDSAGCWAGVSRWVAERLGRCSSCWQFVGAFGKGQQPLPLPPPFLILSGGRGRSVVEGSYVLKLAELGVLCMRASFVTYQRPQGLMQDCLRHWAESQYKHATAPLIA